MKILALVTARGGSKRIKAKNLRTLGGKPLVTWSIEIAKGIAEIPDILVSTDDANIARIAADAGALVPWLRPAELATDTASSVDVALHALDWYEAEKGKVDGLLLLQPTSPFRSRKTVLRGLELFHHFRGRPVIAVGPAKSHPLRCYQVVSDGLQPFIEQTGPHLRSQDLPPAYALTGSCYLISPGDLRLHLSFHPANAVPLVVEDEREALDIDTEWDWRVAEASVLQ